MDDEELPVEVTRLLEDVNVAVLFAGKLMGAEEVEANVAVLFAGRLADAEDFEVNSEVVFGLEPVESAVSTPKVPRTLFGSAGA